MTFCHLVTCRCWQTNNSLLRSLTAEAKHCGLGFVAPSTGDVILEQTKHPGRRGVDVRTIEASVSQSVLDSGPLGTILRVTSFYFILFHSTSFCFILRRGLSPEYIIFTSFVSFGSFCVVDRSQSPWIAKYPNW